MSGSGVVIARIDELAAVCAPGDSTVHELLALKERGREELDEMIALMVPRQTKYKCMSDYIERVHRHGWSVRNREHTVNFFLSVSATPCLALSRLPVFCRGLRIVLLHSSTSPGRSSRSRSTSSIGSWNAAV